MELCSTTSSLTGILSDTQSIPYEILKYYGFAHQSVKLLSRLWKKAYNFYLKMKETAFFDNMMETVTINAHQIQLIWDEIEQEQSKHGWDLNDSFDQVLESRQTKNWVIEYFKDIAWCCKIKYSGGSSSVYDLETSSWVRIYKSKYIKKLNAHS